MNAAEKPRVTLIHTLPGRVRVRLSLRPKDVKKMISAVLNHDGIQSIHFSPITRSVLVRYDHGRVTQQEIVFRIALAISLDYGTVPVRILSEPGRRGTSDSAALSAFLLVAAVLARWKSKERSLVLPLELVAGAGTGYAVLDHGWREVRERGYFDPEVLSLGYLVMAFFRGNFLKASVVTWLMTFGRHLLDAPRASIEVRPVEITQEGDTAPRYEVVVGPDMETPNRARFLDAVRGFLKYAITGGGAHGRHNLMDEFRNVSKLHNEVLEGLGWMSHGIPMRFR
jgi:hypothetical protein